MFYLPQHFNNTLSSCSSCGTLQRIEKVIKNSSFYMMSWTDRNLFYNYVWAARVENILLAQQCYLYYLCAIQ